MKKNKPRNALLLFCFIINVFNNINKDCVDTLKTVSEKVQYKIGTLSVLLVDYSCLCQIDPPAPSIFL